MQARAAKAFQAVHGTKGRTVSDWVAGFVHGLPRSTGRIEVIHRGKVLAYSPEKLNRLFQYHTKPGYGSERRQMGSYLEVRFLMPKGAEVFLIRSTQTPAQALSPAP